MEHKMNKSTKTLLGISLVILCLLVATLFISGCSNSETENSTTVPQSTPDTTVTGSGTNTTVTNPDASTATSGQTATQKPAESSAITKEAAKEIALKHAGATENNVQRFRSKQDFEDGRQVFEIEFDFEGFEYDYEIDAKSGEILKFDKESR